MRGFFMNIKGYEKDILIRDAGPNPTQHKLTFDPQ